MTPLCPPHRLGLWFRLNDIKKQKLMSRNNLSIFEDQFQLPSLNCDKMIGRTTDNNESFALDATIAALNVIERRLNN